MTIFSSITSQVPRSISKSFCPHIVTSPFKMVLLVYRKYVNSYHTNMIPNVIIITMKFHTYIHSGNVNVTMYRKELKQVYIYSL